MAVYINGLQMPPNCWWCPVKFWNDVEYICPFSHKHINSGDADRHDDCPLLPVPDHGRLIDADALKMKMQIGDCAKEGCGESKHRYGSYCWLDDKGAMVCDAINEAPTIIEADRSEE